MCAKFTLHGLLCLYKSEEIWTQQEFTKALRGGHKTGLASDVLAQEVRSACGTAAGATRVLSLCWVGTPTRDTGVIAPLSRPLEIQCDLVVLSSIGHKHNTS